MSTTDFNTGQFNWKLYASNIQTNPNQNLQLDILGNSSIIFRNNGTQYASMDTSFNFTNPPNCSTVATTSTQLVNKTYVDTTATTALINIIYPVGIIISTSTSTNPGTYITGTTWIAYGEGQTLVGKATSGTFGTAGSTGGTETVTITANNLPAHSHPNTLSDPGHGHDVTVEGSGSNNAWQQTGFSGLGYVFNVDGVNNGLRKWVSVSNTTGVSISNANNVTTNTGLSVLQPYIVVYYWTRTV